MLLRAAIVMLVMLNLGAAGWWAFRPALKAAEPAVVPEQGLRLVRETRVVPVPAEPAPVASPPPAQPPVAGAAPAAAPVQAPAAAPATAAAVCLRFGPFADARARDAARTALAGAGVQAVAHDVAARGARGWNVFLPAQPSREAAVAQAEKLKAAGVGDLFVMTTGEEANSIALGRFSSEAGARRRLAELQGKGVQAQAAPVGGTPAQAWLDARLPAEVTRASLARIAPSQPLDCAQLR